MNESVLDGRKILAVDDEPDVLTVLEEEIADACPNTILEKATTYEEAKGLMESGSYDLVILDIMGVRGFDLLGIAVKKGFKAAILTAHALSPETLARSIEMKARAYISKDKLGLIVPFLEDMLRYDYESGLYHSFPESSSASARDGGEKKEGGSLRRRAKRVSWY